MHNTFAHPWFLGTLVMLTGLALLAWRGRHLRRRALADLRGSLSQSGRSPFRIRFFRATCLVLGLVFLCLGTAGPQWGRDWDQAASPGRDLVVVLDRSRSMLAEKPSRLERARAALLEFTDFLKKRGGGDRLAFVVFAAQPKLVCPLTRDYDYFRETVAAIDPDFTDPDLAATAGIASGTRIGLGLQLAVLAHAGPTSGARAILLLSDGDDPAHDGEWGQGVVAARAAGIPVFTVGLGDPDQASPIPGPAAAGERSPELSYNGQPVRSRLEEGPLRQIASDTGGTYTSARRQTPPLGPLYLQMMASGPTRDDNEDALPVYRQRPLWFLTPALVLLVLAMVIGDGASARRQP